MTISRKLCLVAGCATMALAVAATDTEAANTATAASKGTVAAPISIVKNTDLDFGKFTPGAAGGTLILSTAGGRTVTGDVTFITSSTPSAATFTIGGEANATYSWNFPSSVTMDGPSSSTLLVNGFTFLADAGTIGAAGGQLPPAASTQNITVGGTANVIAGQTVGDYTANINLTVNYN